jgi:hypothetical protein
LQTPPQPPLSDIPEASDSENDEGVEGEGSDPEIDEQSDDEDDRQAHAFLRASQNQVTAACASQQPATSVPGIVHDHTAFAVSIIFYKLCPIIDSETGSWYGTVCPSESLQA